MLHFNTPITHLYALPQETSFINLVKIIVPDNERQAVADGLLMASHTSYFKLRQLHLDYPLYKKEVWALAQAMITRSYGLYSCNLLDILGHIQDPDSFEKELIAMAIREVCYREE